MAAVNSVYDFTLSDEDNVIDHCTEVCSVCMYFIGLEYSHQVNDFSKLLNTMLILLFRSHLSPFPMGKFGGIWYVGDSIL